LRDGRAAEHAVFADEDSRAAEWGSSSHTQLADPAADFNNQWQP
jgi:hypothetical protein